MSQNRVPAIKGQIKTMRGVRIVMGHLEGAVVNMEKGERRKMRVNVRVEIAIKKEIILPLVTIGESEMKMSIHQVAEVSAVGTMIVLLVAVQTGEVKANSRRNVSAMIFIIMMIFHTLPLIQIIMEALHQEEAIWGEAPLEKEVIWVGGAVLVVVVVGAFFTREEVGEAEAWDLAGVVGVKVNNYVQGFRASQEVLL